MEAQGTGLAVVLNKPSRSCLEPTIVQDAVTGGEGVPAPMLSVTGLSLKDLEPHIKSAKFPSSRELQDVRISAQRSQGIRDYWTSSISLRPRHLSEKDPWGKRPRPKQGSIFGAKSRLLSPLSGRCRPFS